MARIEQLEREVRYYRDQLANIRRDPGDMPVTGCGDNSCILARPTGMATNGGCQCDPLALRQAVVYWRRLAEFRLATICELRAKPKGGADG